MEFKRIYFLGIGGIGMSALARYFMHEGRDVAGYDRTASALTRQLEQEGASIHYADDPLLIDVAFRDKFSTLVIYTPAIPPDHREWAWFREHGFTIEKRSQALGHVSEGKRVMAVAGTHGKTTTTTLTAWLNHRAGGGGSAFLGGISKNFGSNLVLGPGERLAVEADEFDRSFLQLHPDAAVVTSADADHLDIYGTHEAVKEAFSQFVRQIKPGGTLIIKQGVDIALDNPDIRVYHYAYEWPAAGAVGRRGSGAPGPPPDFYARNIALREGGYYDFDIVCPDMVLEGCTLGIPGWVNVENAVAAVALVWAEGFDAARVQEALKEFKGVKRRFDFWINTPELVYMDDYAHHPRELEAAITSVRGMFPGRRLTAVFQPHLYTRTRDFFREFAAVLSRADQVVLVPIYPAREQPIEGITSERIAELVTVPHRIVLKDELAAALAGMKPDVVVTFGAGDIELYCGAIAEALRAWARSAAEGAASGVTAGAGGGGK